MRLLLLLLLIPAGLVAQQASPWIQLATVQDKRIDESSGVAFSGKYPDAVWTHNDSGGKPEVYLVSIKTGETLATLRVSEARNKDWEDIAVFEKDGKSYILIADVGDNDRKRKDCELLLFPEPELEIGENPTLTITDLIILKLSIEGGAMNCEGVVVDSENGEIILLEKVFGEKVDKAGIYSVGIPEKNSSATAKRIGQLPVQNITAADISGDGSVLAFRTYYAGFVFYRDEGQSWSEAISQTEAAPFPLPFQMQGEGLCLFPDGKAILLSSEKKQQPFWQIRLQRP